MSKRHDRNQSSKANLPEGFFDFDKKSKKDQGDELERELEQFEREMETLEAESEEKLKEEFSRLQEEKNIDELDQQIDQWKKIIELEKKAEDLRNKPFSESPTKKLKIDQSKDKDHSRSVDDNDLDDIEDFEDKLLDWRSKGL